MNIVPLTGPINCSIAHEVLKTNSTKIVKSSIDVFLFATDLNSRNVISEPFYKRIIDSHTGVPTQDRLIRLLSNITDVVNTSEKAFKQVLLSIAECGKKDLSDELYQTYCSKI